MRFFNTFFLAGAVLLCSCTSSGRFAPPSEDKIIMQNEALQAFNAASKCEEKKDYRAAISYYEKSMEYDVLYESAYYKTGRCYALLKEWKKAEEIFLDILRSDSENTSIKDSLGYVYFNSGRTEQAEELYGTLTRENPFNAELSYKYIKTLIQNGKKDEACHEFEKFKVEFPRNKVEIKKLTELLSD